MERSDRRYTVKVYETPAGNIDAIERGGRKVYYFRGKSYKTLKLAKDAARRAKGKNGK